MLTPPSGPYESHRRAELRLRTLLFGDEGSPGVIRGGEEARLRVRAELRRMRQAMDDLASAQEEASAPEPPAVDLAEELRRAAASARAEGHDPELLRPAEAARALGVSVSSIYRAVRIGDVRAVRLAGKKRGGMRILTSEVRRLADETTSRDA
jgi:excisionase family DNA binding protein